MRVQVLGTFTVTGEEGQIDIGGARPRALMALLTQSAGSNLTTERLIDGIWGEDLPSRPRKTLQVMVSNLRKALGSEGQIATTSAGYRLETAGLEVDARAFERLIAEASETSDGLVMLDEALALWHGEPYAGIDIDAVRPEARRLEELKASAEEARAARLLDGGHLAEAVSTLESLAAREPLRELRWELLMTALYRVGRQADALRTFERARRLLAEELGIEPSPSLVALEQRILEQDPTLAVREVAVVEASNPYVGLLAFGEEDADRFFGREAFIARLTTRLGGSSLLALVAPSGAGKSSVISAGVIPALRAGRIPGMSDWAVAAMRPGEDAFAAMDAVLARLSNGLSTPGELASPEAAFGRPLLLIIDQAEELYGPLHDDESAAQFLQEVGQAADAGSIRVLMAIRADSYGSFLAHPVIGPMLVDGTLPLPPMTGEELAQAISGPMAQTGLMIDPSLVERLVEDAAGEPSALPLLQFVLAEMFAANPSDMGLDAYRRLGGLTGALTQRADALYQNLAGAERVVLRQMLLRLVAIGDVRRDTRRRVDRSELESLSPLAGGLIELLAGLRLVALDRDPVSLEPTVDLAHEALISGWSTLGGWIDEARQDAVLHRSLRDAASEWDKAGRPQDLLLAEGRLARYQVLESGTHVALSTTEQSLLEASHRRLREAERAESDRQERELKLARAARSRARAVAVVLAVGVALTGMLSVFAIDQRGDARQQRDVAEEQRADAETTVRELVAARLPGLALELRTEDPELAALLAGEAIAAADAVDSDVGPAVAALHLALQEAGVWFPRDARSVLVATSEGLRGVLEITISELLALRADVVGRQLTEAECNDYLERSCFDTPVAERLSSARLDEFGVRSISAVPPLRGSKLEIGLNFLGSTYSQQDQRTTAWRNELLNLAAVGNGVSISLGIDAQGQGTDVFSVTALEIIDPGIVVDDLWRLNAIYRSAAMPLTGILTESQVQAASNEHLRVAVGGSEPWGVLVELHPESVVVYRRDVFDELGITTPETFEELEQVTAQLAASGLTPWCLGLGADPPASLMPMIGARVIDIGGIDLYDAWINREIPTDHPVIVEAHRQTGSLLFENAGDKRSILERSAYDVIRLRASPAACAMWTTWDWTRAVKAGGVLDDPRLGMFLIPSSDPARTSMLVSGVGAVVVKDSPETRSMVRLFTTPFFGRQLAEGGSTVAANLRLQPEAYEDPLLVELAEVVRASSEQDRIRLSMGNVLPVEYLAPYFGAFSTWFMEGADAAEDMLADVEERWTEIEVARG